MLSSGGIFSFKGEIMDYDELYALMLMYMQKYSAGALIQVVADVLNEVEE